MHRYFTKAIVTVMAALLFAFPAYAKTERAAAACPFDIVSATIQNVTFGIRKAEAEAKAKAEEKKAAEKEEARKKAEAEEAAKKAAEEAAKALENQPVPVAAQAAVPETYTQTSAQVYNEQEQEAVPVQYQQEETQVPETTVSYAEEQETEATQQVEQAAEAQEQETSAEVKAEEQEVNEQAAAVQTAEETKTEETQARSSSKDNTYEGEKLNAVNGMIEGPSGTETYYNLNMSGVVSNMQDMGIQGEYWVRDDGVKMYGDYVMAAANLDTHPYGTIVDSSLGEAIVVDTGDFAAYDEDQLDIAVDW